MNDYEDFFYEVRQTIFALYVDTSYLDEWGISTVFYICLDIFKIVHEFILRFILILLKNNWSRGQFDQQTLAVGIRKCFVPTCMG